MTRNAWHTVKNTRLTLAMLIVFGVVLNLLAVSDGQAQLFLGCFKDQPQRDLDGLLAHGDNLTAAQCVATCRSGGFRFAGTQYGSECHCGNSYGRSGAAGNCNMPCSGKRAEMCGGYYANSIYAAGELAADFASHPFEGTWLSNWGPYAFVAEATPGGTAIRGFFQQGPGQKGTITDGRYDPEKRQLTFTRFQDWNAQKGTVTLTLAPTGRTMTGTWQQPDGSGPLTMQLAFRGDPPKAAEARAHGMAVSNKPRLEVLPVLVIPRDANWITQRDIDLYSYLIFAHLELAQQHYKSLLGTDTFKISGEPLFVYRSPHDDAYYLEQIAPKTPGPDAPHLITGEILRARHQDRYSSNNIYVIIYVRATPRVDGKPVFGGGRTFNGPPNTGGGVLDLELSSLLRDDVYAFQAALTHEVGHTFGLQHVDVYGYNMSTNESMMAYNSNPKYKTRGLNPALANLNPEEFFALGENKRVFPDFRYVPAEHNPNGRKFNPVYFGCMNDEIGQRRGFRGKSCMGYPCPCK